MVMVRVEIRGAEEIVKGNGVDIQDVEVKEVIDSGDGGGEVTGATELLEVMVDGFGSDTVESVVVERILETVTEDEDVEDVSEERVDELEPSTLDRVDVAVLDSDMVVGVEAGPGVVID